MIRFLTAGESHGKGLVGMIEGIPAGLELAAEYIDHQLYRRQQGYGRGGRMKIESDRAEIISGLRLGKTIGSPIGLLVWNKDWENWKDVMPIEAQRDKNKIKEVRALDPEDSRKMMDEIKAAQKEGNSLGGIFEVVVDGLPAGLGSYTHWDKKLDGILAQYICSIPAVKGVEIGDAFENAEKLGSDVHDEIFYDEKKGYYRKTNRSGGLEGGMTTGERLILRGAMKPIPTLARPLMSVDIETKKSASAHKERTDTCSVPAAAVVAEAMTALALIDPFLEKFGGDSMEEIKRHFQAPDQRA